MQPVEQLMVRVAEVCAALRLPYFVTGSLAGMRYGEARFTQDVDIVIELPSWKVAEFCAAFAGPEFYVEPEAALKAVRECRQFNIIWTANGVKADIIAFRDTPFNESRLSRPSPGGCRAVERWCSPPPRMYCCTSLCSSARAARTSTSATSRA